MKQANRQRTSRRLPAAPRRTPSRSHALMAMGALLVALAALVGCEETTPVGTVPSFGTATVSNQAYTVRQLIEPLTLPPATGGDGLPVYTLNPPVPGLTFAPASRTLSGTPSLAGTYTMTYKAADSDTNVAVSDAAILKFTITVAPEGESRPSFGNSAVANQRYEVETAIPTLTLPAASGGNGRLRYSLTPSVPGLTFIPATRTLTGRPTITGNHSMTYTAEDSDTNTDASDSATLRFTITIVAPADGDPPNLPERSPTFGGANVPHRLYVVGQAIPSLQLPAASGGNGRLVYSLGPIVPAGLIFDPFQRTLSGNPSAIGTFVMTYAATDEDGDKDMRTFSIGIDATAPTDTNPRFDKTSGLTAPSYKVGERTATPWQLPAATTLGNGWTMYSLTPDLSPYGLDFDPAKREVSGVPSLAGTWRMTYKVVDADTNDGPDDEDTWTFTLTIDPEDDTSPTFGGTVGDTPFPFGLKIGDMELPEATGGNGQLIYSLRPKDPRGLIPPGLTFKSSTREITGTPTKSGTYPLIYMVEDSDTNRATNDIDEEEFVITVTADSAPTFGGETQSDKTYPNRTAIDTLTLPAATQASDNGDLTYSLTPSVPGLNFNPSTRELTGTPTRTGTYKMTYTVVDEDINTAKSDTDELKFTITVN